MTNKYLEKLASTALQRNIAAGKVTSVSGLDRSGNSMAASSLNEQVAGGHKTGVVQNPAVRTRYSVNNAPYKSFANKSTGNTVSGDSLARSSIQDRLKAHQVGQANGAVRPAVTKSVFGNPVAKKAPGMAENLSGKAGALFSKAKSIAGKAVGFAKKNPIVAGAGALVAAGVAGHSMAKKDNSNYSY